MDFFGYPVDFLFHFNAEFKMRLIFLKRFQHGECVILCDAVSAEVGGTRLKTDCVLALTEHLPNEKFRHGVTLICDVNAHLIVFDACGCNVTGVCDADTFFFLTVYRSGDLCDLIGDADDLCTFTYKRITEVAVIAENEVFICEALVDDGILECELIGEELCCDGALQDEIFAEYCRFTIRLFFCHTLKHILREQMTSFLYNPS